MEEKKGLYTAAETNGKMTRVAERKEEVNKLKLALNY